MEETKKKQVERQKEGSARSCSQPHRNLQSESQGSPTVRASWLRMVDMLHLMIHSTPIIKIVLLAWRMMLKIRGSLTVETLALLQKWRTKWIKTMAGQGDCWEIMPGRTTMGYSLVGKQNEDSNSHLMDFDEIMNTFHYKGASNNAIYLRGILFSPKDEAKIRAKEPTNRINPHLG
ncbi:hypothetical protein H5410_005292 [Solanum commersonii]|uniref:Uncharacterized protein n=1 Tax=Solanum commersonii TaxID=4109 RepID=A0A9J6A6U5_SOLCO|nr:hypothetical protein H5410_005292 [Solanum commersonii]